MATNDFLTFAAATGANVLTQSAYADPSNTARQTGYVTGTASSAAVNKTLRQTSIMSSMIGKFIADQTSQNVVDDGTIATIETNFAQAILNVAAGRVIQISDVVGLTSALNGKLSTTGNAASASKWASPITLTLSGTVNGSAAMDGSSNVSLTTTVADGSLSIAKTSGLQDALNNKQNNLGFTPVQQGGGNLQGVDKVFIGWGTDGSGLRVQVNSSDFGPITLNSAFPCNLSTNGWSALPNGLIIQWCFVSTGSGEGPVRINFPRSFPNACLNVTGNVYNASNSDLMDFWLQINSFDRNGVNAYYQGAAPASGGTRINPSGAYVWAIGC